jgi:ABC-2 type transport system ATP-binding protein
MPNDAPVPVHETTSLARPPRARSASGQHPAGTRAIEVRGLHKSFGPTHAVAGVDLAVVPGEVVAFLGPNGAGKSTTVDLMLGLSTPDAGTVRLFGGTPAQAVAAGMVGAMLQTGGLPQLLTVRELIDMTASLYEHPFTVDEVLRAAGLEDVAARRADRLSGGQSQRMRFALALVSKPALLVLDEPTVSLDVEARHEFWTAVRGIAAGGTTVLFATHYLEEADAFADRIVLMARGVIVADGPATEIKAVVGRRTIRATLPDVDAAELGSLPGVRTAEPRGDAVVLSCDDSDIAVRALMARYPQAHDLEITGAGLEEAFRQLTADASVTTEGAQR